MPGLPDLSKHKWPAQGRVKLRGKPNLLGTKEDNLQARGLAELRAYLNSFTGSTSRLTDRDGEAQPDQVAVDFQKLSAARTLQLYKATPGDEIKVMNSDGTADGTKTITIIAYPGSVINGSSTLVLNSAYASAYLRAVESAIVEGRVDWTRL